MFEYKVMFSFLQDEKRVKDVDCFLADSAEEAESMCLAVYCRLDALRIERIYVLLGERWIHVFGC